MPFKFEQLKDWQLAVDLTEKVHMLTKTFPKDEIFVLSQQMRRAADSVALNIAEGSTGQSNEEFKKFLGYALRSGIEVVSCLYLAKRRGYIHDQQFHELYNFIDTLVKMIQSLRNSLN
jgi:four helix bundle protein